MELGSDAGAAIDGAKTIAGVLGAVFAIEIRRQKIRFICVVRPIHSGRDRLGARGTTARFPAAALSPPDLGDVLSCATDVHFVTGGRILRSYVPVAAVERAVRVGVHGAATTADRAGRDCAQGSADAHRVRPRGTTDPSPPHHARYPGLIAKSPRMNGKFLSRAAIPIASSSQNPLPASNTKARTAK